MAVFFIELYYFLSSTIFSQISAFKFPFFKEGLASGLSEELARVVAGGRVVSLVEEIS